MALFKISKGLKNNLPNSKVEGYCYFTTDDGKFHIDVSNSQRVTINADKADKDRLGNLIDTSYVKLTSEGIQTITTANGNTSIMLKSNNTNSYIGFINNNNTTLGYIGINANNKPIFYNTKDNEIALRDEVTQVIFNYWDSND